MDLKGIGYLISTISVFFLGIVAWPKPEDPSWHAWAVAIGMASSIAGMGLRYLSHRKDRKDIERAARDEPPKSDQAG
jgi:hypothetical protein